MSLLDAALAYAAKGVRVFPVGLDKAPRTSRGFHDATTDEATIRAWDWNGGNMIAAVPAPGTVVVDVDPRNGGDDTLRVLAEAGHELPATRTVATRSGGRHHYFTVPEDITLRATLGPGVDIKRADKGYVVIPPSEGYSYLRDGEAAPAPEWLLDELRVEERDAAASAPSDPKYMVFEDGTTYGLAALEREVGRLATTGEGGRNNALNRAAFAMAQLVAGGELKEERAVNDLFAVAEQIGLEPREARLTLRSGWKAGEQAPRQAAPRETEAASIILPTAEAPAARTWLTDWTSGEHEAPAFLIHPFLPANAYVIVYGPTEAAKSMVWAALAAEATRRGQRWSIYSLENPAHVDRERLYRLRAQPGNLRVTHDALDVNDPRQLAAMVEDEKAWGTDVVLIDTYSHAFNSRSDDGNAKAIDFARRMRYVMHAVGCSVVIVDHTGFEGDLPRDASAKLQQVDVGILMRGENEWMPGEPARFSMRSKKSARFGNPFRTMGEIRDIGEDASELTVRWTSGDEPTWPA